MIKTYVKQSDKENKYYFFDQSIVRNAENTCIKQSEAEKVITNASWIDQYNWTPDSGIPDWEHRVSIMYPNVEYDEENKKYKIWYHALNTNSPVDEYRWRDNLIDKNNSNNVELDGFCNTAQGVIHKGHDVLCYMESDDGLNWVRPELGEFFYKTRRGEIIGTNIAYIGMHGLGVHKNENPDSGEPKYLMAGRTWDTDSLDARGEPIGVAISFSDDGIHWEDPITIKTAYDCASDLYYVRADTHNQLIWSTEKNKYVVITRGYLKNVSGIRVVAYMESTADLESVRVLQKEKCTGGIKYWDRTAKYWSTPEIVLDKNVTADFQPYSMPFTHLANGYYVGIASIANFEKGEKGIWNSVHAELTWSPDAKIWQYIDKGNPFIKNAKEFCLAPGNDYGMIYCAAPVTVEDKTEIFYTATPELHYIKYGDIPENIKQIVDEKNPEAAKAEAITRTSTLNIARIKKDCYAGIWAENGYIITEAFEVTGNDLRITADIADGGSLAIEILDSDDNVVCTPCKNLTDKTVCDISMLKGKRVYFKIFLKNASVCAISGNIEIRR